MSIPEEYDPRDELESWDQGKLRQLNWILLDYQEDLFQYEEELVDEVFWADSYQERKDAREELEECREILEEVSDINNTIHEYLKEGRRSSP